MGEVAAARHRAETLDFMQGMLAQLRTMAQAERCDMLVYLIEMAYTEVGDIMRGDRALGSGEQKRNPPAGVSLESSR